MKYKKQIRLVHQDGCTSLRIVLFDDDGEIVHIGEDPIFFSAPDIERLFALYNDAVLCFSLPIITIPTRKTKTLKTLMAWDYTDYPKDDG